MNYQRLVSRNAYVWWGYRGEREDPKPQTDYEREHEYLSGEFRRMEEDQMNASEDYALQAGITRQQAEIVLRSFLGIPEPDCSDCNKVYHRDHGRNVLLGRCMKHVVYGRSPSQ